MNEIEVIDIIDKFVAAESKKENRQCLGLMCLGCSNNGVCEQEAENE